MSEENKDNLEQPEETPEEGTEEEQAAQANAEGEPEGEQNSEEASEAPAEEAAEVEAPEELGAKIQGLQEQLLRQAAEFENFKKRSLQETTARIKYAATNLVKDLLPGLDNLERALEHAENSGEENAELKQFIEGVEMVQNQFYEALKKNHVERYAPQGEPFDPNLHEAVGMIPSDEVEPDHVALVMQAGYKLHDRVLRAAMVQVAAKG